MGGGVVWSSRGWVVFDGWSIVCWGRWWMGCEFGYAEGRLVTVWFLRVVFLICMFIRLSIYRIFVILEFSFIFYFRGKRYLEGIWFEIF